MAIEKRWIINLKGRDYPQWGGVLDAAHRAGLRSLTTEVLQFPEAANEMTAVVRAVAVFEGDRVFSDVGDASPRNVARHLVEAIIRMASTRAKGRALRDALNVGETMYEELPEEQESTATDTPSAQRPSPSAQPRAARAVQSAERETVAARVSQPPPPPKWRGPDGKMYSKHDLVASLALRQARAEERGLAWHPFDVDAADEEQIYEELAALVAAIQAHDSWGPRTVPAGTDA